MPSAQAAEEKQGEAGHLELRVRQLKEEVGSLTSQCLGWPCGWVLP